jgi:hypothetical protein
VTVSSRPNRPGQRASGNAGTAHQYTVALNRETGDRHRNRHGAGQPSAWPYDRCGGSAQMINKRNVRGTCGQILWSSCRLYTFHAASPSWRYGPLRTSHSDDVDGLGPGLR